MPNTGSTTTSTRAAARVAEPGGERVDVAGERHDLVRPCPARPLLRLRPTGRRRRPGRRPAASRPRPPPVRPLPRRRARAPAPPAAAGRARSAPSTRRRRRAPGPPSRRRGRRPSAGRRRRPGPGTARRGCRRRGPSRRTWRRRPACPARQDVGLLDDADALHARDVGRGRAPEVGGAGGAEQVQRHDRRRGHGHDGVPGDVVGVRVRPDGGRFPGGVQDRCAHGVPLSPSVGST